MLTTILLGAALAAIAVEKPYDFRARLDCVHQPDARDRAAKPTAIAP